MEPNMPIVTLPSGLTRRSFLELAAPLALAWPLSGRLHAASRKIPVALQLYSLRDDCKADFDATLGKVAEMGFAGVEFAGYYGYDGKAAALRARLESLGLKAAGTHIGLDKLQGDALKQAIDFHKEIGCRFLIVPSNADATSPTKSRAFADAMNHVAGELKPHKMATGFHCHAGEFKKDGGKTYWDLFAERTKKDVILQQDCGWTMAAGFDPIEYVKKYPKRTKTVHFKPTVREGETARTAILGQDSVNWPGVYAACLAVGGTEWIVLEQEVYPNHRPPIDCTRDSFAALKALIA
jgi:sugar phosphate isomerase/epimerase